MTEYFDENTIIGITFGAFDLLHVGHVSFLEACRSYCDKLYVGVHVDPSQERPEKNRPIQTILERTIQVEALECVDNVFAYETEADILNYLSVSDAVSMRFLGEEYKGKEITAGNVPGIELIYIPRNHSYSSSELRKRIYKSELNNSNKFNVPSSGQYPIYDKGPYNV